jgi:hypothetical protein
MNKTYTEKMNNSLMERMYKQKEVDFLCTILFITIQRIILSINYEELYVNIS